jgi:hypothetical protein
MPSQTGAMSFYREQILPRLTDLALRGKNTAQLRAQAAAGLSGEVLEVGFGSALTMPYYPPAVTRVRAVDPSAVARKLAADRVAASAVPVDYVGVDTVKVTGTTADRRHRDPVWRPAASSRIPLLTKADDLLREGQACRYSALWLAMSLRPC